jgi:starch phosphorylase
LVSNPDRPVQFVFAGKAHPADDAGKEFIREIIHAIRDPLLRPYIVFLEDYGISVARKMVSGVDVWLNTPRRPREASGTSGMKAVVNGVLNASVLDGWWDEGYSPEIGWAIGDGEIYDDHEYQDRVESQAVYDLIEGVIAPLFYKRNPDGIPPDWIKMAKQSIAELTPRFSCARTVAEYTSQFYIPASVNYSRFSADDFATTRQLATLEKKIHDQWPEVLIHNVEPTSNGELSLGESITVGARIELGCLNPDDVLVQVYYGEIDENGMIRNGATVDMIVTGKDGEGVYTYSADIVCETSGHNGYTVRVLPHLKNAVSPFDPRIIKWFD